MMHKKILIIFVIFFIISCKKEEVKKEDRILYTVPNKHLECITTTTWDSTMYVTKGDSYYNIDVNNDSIIDFNINLSTWPGSVWHGEYINDYRTSISSINDNAFIGILNEDYHDFISGKINFDYIINEKLFWIKYMTLSEYHRDFTNFYTNIWIDKYIAFKLQQDNKNYYGWIEVRDNVYGNIQLVAYAINLTPNNEIKVGQIK